MESICKCDIVQMKNKFNNITEGYYVVMNVVENNQFVLLLYAYADKKVKNSIPIRAIGLDNFYVNPKTMIKIPIEHVIKTPYRIPSSQRSYLYNKHDEFVALEDIKRSRQVKYSVPEKENKQYIHFVSGGGFSPR